MNKKEFLKSTQEEHDKEIIEAVQDAFEELLDRWEWTCIGLGLTEYEINMRVKLPNGFTIKITAQDDGDDI